MKKLTLSLLFLLSMNSFADCIKDMGADSLMVLDRDNSRISLMGKEIDYNYTVERKAFEVNDISDCQENEVAIKTFKNKKTGKVFHAVYSTADECDGGNSYGAVLDESLNPVAAINDTYFYCVEEKKETRLEKVLRYFNKYTHNGDYNETWFKANVSNYKNYFEPASFIADAIDGMDGLIGLKYSPVSGNNQEKIDQIIKKLEIEYAFFCEAYKSLSDNFWDNEAESRKRCESYTRSFLGHALKGGNSVSMLEVDGDLWGDFHEITLFIDDGEGQVLTVVFDIGHEI